MRPFALNKPKRYLRRSHRNTVLFASLLLLGTTGCRNSVRTNDQQLKPVQELLDAQLARGTSEKRVRTFLGERGYKVLPSQKPGTVVAVIPTGESREAARVTFYFDANGRLNTFELARASDKVGQR